MQKWQTAISCAALLLLLQSSAVSAVDLDPSEHNSERSLSSQGSELPVPTRTRSPKSDGPTIAQATEVIAPYPEPASSLSVTVVKAIQHRLAVLGFGSHGVSVSGISTHVDVDGVWSKQTEADVAHWQSANGFEPNGILTRAQFETLFTISSVRPVAADHGSSNTAGPEVPFIILDNVTVGGSTTFRSQFYDATLKGLTFEQCLSECAADDRCVVVAFTHGCELASGYDYRHDFEDQYDILDDKSAIVLSRPTAELSSETNVNESFEAITARAISSFSELVAQSGYGDQPIQPLENDDVASLLAFRPHQKVEAGLLEILEKPRPPDSYLNESNPFGRLALPRGRARQFLRRPWILISPQHRQVAERLNGLIEGGQYELASDPALKSILPDLEDVLTQAIDHLGPHHPALGFVYIDLAAAYSDYRLSGLDWVEGETRSRALLAQAAQLLAGAGGSTPSDDQVISTFSAYAQIATLTPDVALYASSGARANNEEPEKSQWGRCFLAEEQNRARSNLILAAAGQNRAIVGSSVDQIGWLKRATNCLVDQEEIVRILRARLTLAWELGDPYILAVTYADLGQALYNSGQEQEARISFRQSLVQFFSVPEAQRGRADFLYAHALDAIDESSDYYSESSGKLREAWRVLAALGMKDELRFAIAKEAQALVSSNLIEAADGSYSLIELTRLFEDAQATDIADAAYAKIDQLKTGSLNPSPIQTILGIVDAINQWGTPLLADRELALKLLQRSVGIAEARQNPEEQARVLTRLAQSLDENGDLVAAASAASRALLLLKENALNADQRDLKNLERLVAATAAETGNISALAATLGRELSKDLASVCEENADLSAFPWLPLPILIDDPILAAAFLEQQVVQDWVDCFESKLDRLDFADWESDYLPVDLLSDLVFVYAERNDASRITWLLDQITQSSFWSRARSENARPTALSAVVDGLALSDAERYFDPYREAFLAAVSELAGRPSDEFGNRAKIAASRLGFSAHLLAEAGAVRTIYDVIKSNEVEASKGPYGLGLCNGRESCRYMYFFSSQFGDSADTDLFKSRIGGLGAPLNALLGDWNSQRLKRAIEVEAILDAKAGRYPLALLDHVDLNFGQQMEPDEVLQFENPLSFDGMVKFAAAYSRNTLVSGDVAAAHKMSQHFVDAARAQTQGVGLFGTDPLLRWSRRLRGTFSAFLDSGSFPIEGSAKGQVPAFADDAFFVTQFLQTTSTAATFAKIASRIGEDSADTTRALQDVDQRISDEYEILLRTDGEASQSNVSTIKNLESQKAQLLQQLEAQNPGALSFAGLQFPSLAELQAILAPGEAVLSFVENTGSVYAWFITRDHYQGRRLPQSPQQIDSLVRQVRHIGDPKHFGDAIELEPLFAAYNIVLQPFESELSQVKSLIFVPHGAIDGLPLGALLTEAPQQPKVSIDDLRDAKLPWLVRKYALSTMPSISAIRYLRTRGAIATGASKDFLGVGNPDFGDGVRVGLDPASPASRGRLVSVRSLPETELEIRGMGSYFDDQSMRDFLLGPSASEENVKRANLSDYRILAFATHGLLANDFPGISEPALLLSTPAADAPDDGILYASEVTKLRLDADLVILSACNTASSDGRPGAEGLSGLTNAFLYAGARGVIATHWQIPSEPAVDLSLGMMKAKREDQNLDWPSALRTSILSMIDGNGPAYFAHPISWAAQIYVGMPEVGSSGSGLIAHELLP